MCIWSLEYCCRYFTKCALCLFLMLAPLLSVPELQAGGSAAREAELATILARMDASYAKVGSYQTEEEVREYQKGKYLETKRFLYTFKKPDQLRIDMRSPKPGTVLIYPDRQGKVTLRPGGWTGFVTLHLSPDNSMLASGNGQRIDQSDFGLLLRNMHQSLTDHRRGEISLTETEGRVSIEVLADDHFLPGVQTLYRFVIDSARFLPVEVDESTPKGIPKRKSIFGSLRTQVAIDDGCFRIK